MKRYICLIIFLIFLFSNSSSYGQVGIGDTDPVEKGIALKIVSDNKGVLLPRIALTSKTSFSPLSVAPPTGALVFNTNYFGSFPDEVNPGLYWWDNENYSWMPFALDTEHYTAKFSNADITTNLFVDSYVGVPVFGKLNFTDMPGEYEIVSSSKVKFNRTGLYSVTVNLDKYVSVNNPIGLKIQLLKDGTVLGVTTRFAISQENEHYYSESFTEYINIDTEGEVLEIQAMKGTTGSGVIRLNEAGTSSVMISRIR